MDIGGGTANLALCKDGNLEAVGCLNVGGRLLKFDTQHRITYVSPVLQGRIPLSVGDLLTRDAAREIAENLAAILEMAAGRREKTPEFSHFLTPGAGEILPEPGAMPSFSRGVADCIGQEHPWDAYGDLGPLLGQAIRESNLCRGNYRLGKETIRATVIGAGCYSTQLSGSTVFLRGAALPVKNLPVAVPDANDAASIRRAWESLDSRGVLHLPGCSAPDYRAVCALADAIAEATGEKPCYVALEADMAKALGHALALRLPEHVPIVCLDGLHIPRQSYLDIGNPVGPAVSVVIKTLAFENH
jgi:ethanolamine utilization protein EutA